MTDADKSLAARLIQALGSSYTVEGELGRGGMGVVYKARDERLKRQVAIKVLPPELAFREEIRIRFLREAETAARLSHPHIVPIHAVGIIHRDVKPDNILLEGSRGRVVVTDFGIAKALSSTTGSATLTATGVAIGTPHYMSPEQAAGDREIDGRSDIYSLGVVSYQMLTGELPFQAPTVPGILMKHITERAPLVTDKCRDCPEDLAACVMRSLEKDPDDRWPTADALRRALEARSATMSRSRRPSGGPAPRALRFPPPPALPIPRSPDVGRRPMRHREAAQLAPAGEADIVRKMRSSFVSWASVAGGCLLFDAATGWHGWSLFVAVPWGAFGLLPLYMRLWSAGYSWRDVLRRPAAPESAEAQLAAAGSRPLDLPAATGDEFGRLATAVQQARNDRKAILKIMERVPKSEKKLLPDVIVTVDGLLKRAEDLARTAHAMSGDVDRAALSRLEDKIEVTKREPDSPERERQLNLLQRQRQTLTDLLTRRQLVEDQIESCVLAMQNVRFDLLRLRSAGVAAVLDDLTHATQQARALSRDVDHAIAAAGEIRAALGEQPGA